jgi:S1-C subfamily serine protease
MAFALKTEQTEISKADVNGTSTSWSFSDAEMTNIPRELRAAANPQAADLAADQRDENAPADGHYGLAVQPVTPETARQLGIERERGLVVTAVEPASAAEAAGFQPRDVITEVNGQRVESVSDLRSAISKSEGRPALVLANRNGQPLYLTLSNS